MKALFIGGTGVISTAVGALALARGWELTLLNRGTNAARAPRGARVLTADIHDEAAVKAALGDERFDVAVDFIAFTEEDVQRDVRLFAGRAAQYIFISSASAYQKPVAALPITESTPLANPYWQYSRDKIACENFLMERYREEGFPVTIVRPSHTYCGGKAVVALHGARGCWQTLARIRAGKPVIIPGDGTSLWTATHADDFAVGFVGLMGNPHALGTAVHITTDEGMTWNQIYAVLASAMGAPLCAAYVASKFLAVCGRAAAAPAERSGRDISAGPGIFVHYFSGYAVYLCLQRLRGGHAQCGRFPHAHPFSGAGIGAQRRVGRGVCGRPALGCGGRGNCHRHRRKPFCNFMCYLYRA